MSFIRHIKKKSGVYLAEVESKRENGKIRQHVIRYIGKEVNGEAGRKTYTPNIRAVEVKRYLDVKLIDSLASQLGLKDIISKEILVFVYAQILDKPGINKLEEWLSSTEMPKMLKIENISTAKLYEALSDFDEVNFKEIEDKIRNKLLPYENDTKSIIIDVTDTYFEGKKVPGKPRKGKEDKVKKLLQIGLAVSKQYGFPLFHNTYEGNISNIKIFSDLLPRLWELKSDPTIMDRGFLTNENLSNILSLKLKTIAGIKRDKYFQKRFLERLDKERLYSIANRVKLKNTEVYVKSFRYKKGKLLVIYNPSLEVLKRGRYYDLHKKEGVAKYLGYSLIYHNTDMKEEDVIRAYFDKDVIERAFRQMKGILSLRPVRVWMQSHIRSHVKICYLSYAILALLSYKLRKLDLSSVEALDKLKSGYNVYLHDTQSDFSWDTTVTLSKLQDKIMNVVYKKH